MRYFYSLVTRGAILLQTGPEIDGFRHSIGAVGSLRQQEAPQQLLGGGARDRGLPNAKAPSLVDGRLLPVPPGKEYDVGLDDGF